MKKRKRTKRNLRRQYIIGGVVLAAIIVLVILLLTLTGEKQAPEITGQATAGEILPTDQQGRPSPVVDPEDIPEETEMDQEEGNESPTEGREPIYDFSVRGDLYWNVDRAQYAGDNATSTRTPSEQGCYVIRFAYDGQLVELQATDKKLVDFIDTMDVMGLVIEANDTVVDVLDPNDVAPQYAHNVYVKSVSADTLETSSTADMNGYIVSYTLSGAAGIYDVTPGAEEPGRTMQSDELKQGDILKIFGDGEGNVTHIFVTAHAE